MGAPANRILAEAVLTPRYKDLEIATWTIAAPLTIGSLTNRDSRRKHEVMAHRRSRDSAGQQSSPTADGTRCWQQIQHPIIRGIRSGSAGPRLAWLHCLGPPFVHGSTRSRVAQRILRVFSRASSLSSFRSKTSRTSCNYSSPYTSARYEGKSVASLFQLDRCRSKTAASGRRGRGRSARRSP